jgi:hypothetical protein
VVCILARQSTNRGHCGRGQPIIERCVSNLRDLGSLHALTRTFQRKTRRGTRAVAAIKLVLHLRDDCTNIYTSRPRRAFRVHSAPIPDPDARIADFTVSTTRCSAWLILAMEFECRLGGPLERKNPPSGFVVESAILSTI